MPSSLAITTLLMGLAGGPHCIVMCGAACAGIRQHGGDQALHRFHFGRLLGYSALGAVAAASVKSLAWFSSQSLALHPLWTFFHALVLGWGLILLIYARQPTWADEFGRTIWEKVRRLSGLPGGLLITGMLWALMPCGLLYSALLVASLNANPISGALCMATFAIGTSISLFIGPWLWVRLKGNRLMREAISMRLAGLLLTAVAGWAIWMDLAHQVKIWCN